MTYRNLNQFVMFSALTFISVNTMADSSHGETGPTKAAKESNQFVEYLDRDEVLGGKFSTWMEFASDYVFRGESETNDGQIPSLKGSITWTHGTGMYLGLYMANNLFPGDDVEGNDPSINAIWGPYIGYATEDIAGTGINYNGMFFKYNYPGGRESNYTEMFNYIDKQFGPVNLKLEYTPTLSDWFGVEDLQSHNVAVHPSVELPHEFTLSGSVGKQMFDNGGPSLDGNGNGKEELDWWHWNIGVSRNVWGFNVDLRYHDTDIKQGEHDFYGFDNNHQIVDERYVISVSKNF